MLLNPKFRKSIYFLTSLFLLASIRSNTIAGDSAKVTFKKIGQNVVETVGPLTWEAETSRASSKDPKESERITVRRNLEFIYKNAELVKTKKGPAMLQDESAIVRQYFPGDTDRFKNVDCRVVAKKMLLTLISNSVESVCSTDELSNTATGKCKVPGGALDGENMYYATRSSKRDTAFAASLFNTVIIDQAKETEDEDQNASMKCENLELKHGKGEEATIENAWCGKLTVVFKPHTPKSGEFADQTAFRFNPEKCMVDKTPDANNEQALRNCETAAQVNACGLRYVQKSLKQDEASQSKWGLSNWIKYYTTKKQNKADYPRRKLVNEKQRPQAAPSGKPFYEEEDSTSVAGGQPAK